MQIPLDSAKPPPWGENFKVRLSEKERGLKKASVLGCCLHAPKDCSFWTASDAVLKAQGDTKCSHPRVMRVGLSCCLLKPFLDFKKKRKKKQQLAVQHQHWNQQGTFSRLPRDTVTVMWWQACAQLNPLLCFERERVKERKSCREKLENLVAENIASFIRAASHGPGQMGYKTFTVTSLGVI